MTEPDATSPTDPQARPPTRWLLGLGLFAVLALVLGLAAWRGYAAGQAQQRANALATQTADLQTQYTLGLANLADGNYALAIARFEYILKTDAAYPGAAEKLAEARAALNITPTAPPAATPTLPPTTGDPQALLALAEQALASENWDGVITYLANLNTLDPNYEAVKVDQLLHQAFRQRGVARIQGDEMGLGITDLDQAEAYAPLDAEAADFRRWAKLYLAAQSYWGVNWEQTTLILQELHLLAPYFKDTTPKLYQATLKYAAQLAASGDVCAAALQYVAAQALFVDPEAANAQATAQANCLLTPTPDPALSATPEGTPLALTPTPQP